MEAKFRRYSLEDFLDDPDFCSWARSERPDLDGFYHQMLEEYPEQKEVFRKASQIVRLFDDKKKETTLARKLQLWEDVKNSYRKRNNPLKYKLIFRYAAAVVLLFAVASVIYYYVTTTTKKEFIASYDQQDFTETKLSLDNGKEIRIQSDQSEIVYDQDGQQLKINDKLVEKEGETRRNAMNQLVVSYGKTSRMILSDQTEVWLNAGSRLIYPAVFEGGKRKVQLQGEAFFKVSHDKTKPFIVETNHSSIKVLGTTFNVKAYPDEKCEETVLVEGSVSLSLGNTFLSRDVLLKPDQRVVVSGIDHSYAVSRVNVRDYTSWIDGLFTFTNEPLPLVLMRVSRYYNIQIKWTNEAGTRKISGKLDLKDDCRRVLHTLATISEGNYEEENGVIFFKLNNNQ
jgi:ferric-dicitrate binding protein FerR (iron transport regulator)